MKSKIFFLLMIFYFGIAVSQTKEDLVEVEKINQYSELIDKESNSKEFDFEIKGKNKIINYKYWKKGNDIVKISREWRENNGNYQETYTDYFLLKDGKRIYASQSIINRHKANTDEVYGWSCLFWIKNNRVFHLTSLGHGKTEADEWDYEKELQENFDYMMKQVQKIEKDKKK